MRVSLGRKYRKQGRFFSALFMRNPVLVLGLDLPFVIACATSLKIAVALSIEMLLIHMVTMVAAMITVHRLPLWSRVLVNAGVSTIMMTVARALLQGMFPDLTNYVGMYVYLMAVNGLTIYQATHVTREDRPWPVLTVAFMNALAFSLTMVLVSLVREYFGNGTLWGIPLGTGRGLGGLLLPFGGFIAVSFFLAFAKFLNKKLLALSIAEAVRRDSKYTELWPGFDEADEN